MIVDVLRHASAAALAEAVAARTVTTLVERVSEAGAAHLCLTGGGIGTAVLTALRDSPAVDAIDWSRVHVWWGDERFVSADDPDRNDAAARDALLDHVDIPAANIHPMPARDRTHTDVDAAADSYAGELLQFARPDDVVPSMDILMLGIGPDGHVASLFPEMPALHDDRPVVGVHGSPKPPPLRITMSLPTICAAQQVWILASGEAKAPAVRMALTDTAGPFQVPAAGARGRVRTLFCLDEAAASALPVDMGRPSA